MRLTPHFLLKEFLPDGMTEDDVPAGVLSNLLTLCIDLLEPARNAIAQPFRITSGWRRPKDNFRVGGVKGSDHETGAAADVQVLKDDQLDPAGTKKLFAWMAQQKAGQVILEDHRDALAKPGRLWVHIAILTQEHKDRAVANRVLVSRSPGSYVTAKYEDLA